LYEQLGRLLGTACKLDFQSTLLSRNGRSDLNSARLALYFADECHKYVISGSSTAGDPYFMNLSRSNNVVNICATQSYAWIVEVIGREAANVYISAFGVQFWLQQTDPETCRRAAEICGTIAREKVSAEHNLDFAGVRGALATGREIVIRQRVRTEEKERFRAEDFAHLDVGDIVAYNKGREGRTAKVAKGRARYHFCTRKPDGVAAVQACVREYFRAVIENLTHERGQTRRWDCVAGQDDALAPGHWLGLPVEPEPESHAVRTAEAGAEIPSSDVTAAQIDRERADFSAWVGTLDAAAGEVGGTDPADLQREREELEGAAAGAAEDLTARARRTVARSESRALAQLRRQAPRPRPAPGAFSAETLRQLYPRA
jgi:hypothetical protein